MSPQEKPCIFVTAPGRAGTGFLARVLSRLVEGCHSVHEPDVLYFYRLLRIVRAEAYLLEKIRDFGVFQMTIGKLLTSGNLRSLGIALAKSSFPEDKAVDAIRAMRVHYISRIELPIYAESNPQLEGVFHLLPIVFPNSKIVYLTRDGRQWVRSFLNRVPVMFWKKDLLSYLPNGRPGAHMFKDDPFYNRWYSFSQFQRLCWLWRFRIGGALRRMKRIENIKIVSYEALLEGEKRQEVFEDFHDFFGVWGLGKEVLPICERRKPAGCLGPARRARRRLLPGEARPSPWSGRVGRTY